MSSVSSITNSSPLTYLQQLQQRQAQGEGAQDQAVTSALQALGIDSSKASTIEGQIQQAVKNVPSESGNPSDRRTAVQQAIDGVLKNNGIDPAQFKSQLQASFQKLGLGRRHRHHATESANQSTANSPGKNAAGLVSANASSSGFSAVA